MERWGAPAHIVDAARPRPLAIYPQNVPVVNFFRRLATQWHVGPMGIKTGLNYTGVESTARLAGVDVTPDFFTDLQIMELAAIKEMTRNV